MKVGLALGGGGARGLAHIGILRELEKARIKIDYIAGTSMGAIIGGLYALYPDSRYVENIVRKTLQRYRKEIISLKNFAVESSGEDKNLFLEKAIHFVKDLCLWNLQIVRPYLVNPRSFFRITGDLFRNKKFVDCRISFIAIVVDLVRGEAFGVNRGSLFKAVTASSLIPGIFPYLKTKGHILVDGGALMPVPIPALFGYADFIIGVSVESEFKNKSVKNAIDILFLVDRLRYNSIVERDLRRADFLLSPQVGKYVWADFDAIDNIIIAGERELQDKIYTLQRTFSWKRGSYFFRKLFRREAAKIKMISL